MSDFNLNILAGLNKRLSKAQIKNGLKTIDNSLYLKVIAKLATSLSKKQLKDDLAKLGDLYVQVGTKFKTDENAKKELLNDIEKLQKNLVELQLKVGIDKTASANTIQSVMTTAKTAQQYADKASIAFNIEIRKEKAINDILYIGQKYSKLFSNVSASQKYENLLSSAYSISDKSQLQEVRAQIAAFTSELKTNGLAAESTSDKWKKLIDRAKDLFSAATLVRIAFTQVRQAISTTLDLDKTYTDLVKVNDELTRNDYGDYLSRINKKAKELATTQKGLIEGATEFSKSGYDLSTSDKLSSKSAVLANVGDMSASDSTKAIISGVQAYDVIDGYADAVNKAQALIDKYNEVGNTAAILTSEIAQGVQSVGSVFSDANTSVDEFIALLAAGNRQFQNADSLALGLRTSALRIRGCTTELEAMGEETDTVVTSVSSLEEKIKGLTNIDGRGGVEILEADGKTFRSIYDIFLDISKVYKDMSDVDQSALLELIAGKNRASAISATLNNMSEAEEILQNSLNAAGSAQEEYNAYLESAEAHIAQFQARLVEMYSTFMNGDMISHTADIGSAVLDLVNSTDLLKHSILAVLALNIGKGISAIGAGIVSTTQQMNMLGNALQQIKNLPLDDDERIDVLAKVSTETQNLTEKNLKLLLSQKQLAEEDRLLILSNHNLTEEEAQAKLEKMGLISATQAQSAANVTEATTTGVLQGALTSLKASIVGVGASMKAAFLSNPIGVGLMAVTTAISIGTTIINKHKQSIEETKQAMQEAKQEYESLASEVTTLNEELETTQKRLEELEAIGYNNLSVVEKNEYNTLKKTNDELERELRIKEALTNIKSKEVGENAVNTLSKQTDVSLEKHTYGAEGVELEARVDIVESANEYFNLAEKQKQSLENAKQALIDYENAYKGTSEQMMQDKSWLKLNDNVSKAEATLSDTEKIISEKYESIEEDADGLVDSFGNVIAGCEDMYQRVNDLKNRMDTYFNPIKEQVKEMSSELHEEMSDGSASFNISAYKDQIDDFQSSTEKLSEALQKIKEGDLSDSDLLDLQQEFPQLTDESDNLSDAINDLIDESLQSLVETLEAAGASDELITLVRNVAAEAMNSDDLNSSIDSLQSAYSTLSDAIKEYNSTGTFTLDTLQTLLSLEPQYLNCLMTENGQLALNEQALAALANQRLDDAEAQAVQNAIEQINTLTEQANAQAKDQNAASAENAMIKMSGYNAVLSETTTQAITAAGAVSALNQALDGASVAGVSQEDIGNVMGTLDAQLKAIDTMRNKVNSGSVDGVLKTKSSSGSSGTDAYKEAFEKELAELQYLRDKDVISETEYYQQLKELNEKYFAGKEKYLDEYRKYEVEVYNYEKELNDKIMDDLQSSMDELQSSLKTLQDAQEQIRKFGAVSIDTLQEMLQLEPQYLAQLSDENGQISINEESFRKLAAVKVQEMQITYARQAIDLINTLTTEAKAAEWLAGANAELTGTTTSLTEALLQQAVAAAHLRGEMQGQAADTILQAYNNAKQLVGMTDFSIDSLSGEELKTAEEEFEELIDFFERRVNVLDNAFDLLKTNINNVVGSAAKNNLIDAQSGILEERFKNYSDAVNMYTQKANEALSKLDGDLQEKIKNGAVDLTTFVGEGNEDVVEAIKDYEQWADKVADCKQELAELKAEIRELELEKFNNIIEDFTNQFDIYDDSIDLIDKQIALFEKAGQVIGESFYSKQKEQSQKQLNVLEAEKVKLVEQLNSALNSGRVQVGTDEFLEMVNALSEVDGSILDCKKSIEEFDNAILELHWEVFDRIQDQFGNIDSELKNIIGLIDDIDVADEKGVWSDEGLTQLGLYAQQYELATYQVTQYNDAINQLNSDYLAGKYSATEYADKLAELKEAQWEAVNSAEAAKDAIVDLNEARVDIMADGIEKEIDKYKELIDAEKKALESEKALNDYRKSIQEKGSNIESLERQIAAMMNDTSAAGIAKRKLKEQELAEAKHDLADYEADHAYDQKIDALDKEYEAFEAEKNAEIEALRATLENEEMLIYQSFENVKANAAIVGQEIANIALQHGVVITDSITSAWAAGENAIASYGTMLSDGTIQFGTLIDASASNFLGTTAATSSAFIQNLVGVEGEVYQLQADANSTANSLAYMFATRADTLVNELTASYNSEANVNAMTQALHDSLIQTLEGGYNISSITSALDSIASGANNVASAARDAASALASMGAAQSAAVSRGSSGSYSSGSSGSGGYTYQDAGSGVGNGIVRVSDSAGNLVAITRKDIAEDKYKATRKYAKGTRNAKAGLAVVDEEGKELQLEKLTSGKYKLLGEGDQIFTKAQTDALYELSKDPSAIFKNAFVPPKLPEFTRVQPDMAMNFDSLITINGDFNNSEQLLKQMQNCVQQGIRQVEHDINRRLRY